MENRAFRAMGTDVEVLAHPVLPEGRFQAVRRHFEAVEASLSRFRPGSELSLLNASAGRPFAASPLLRQVLADALAAAEVSCGLFDPTVLHAVRAAGYRRSFETLGEAVQTRTAVRERSCLDQVQVGEDGTVTVPAGYGIDLGGFAKGWTVDSAAPLMDNCKSWVINAGGDLVARGAGPDGDGWTIGIEDPFGGPDLGVMRVTDTAVATSTTQRRRWLTDHGVAHHIIDPRTGEPSDTDLAAVTVMAETAAKAEVAAKTVLLLGCDEGRAYAERHTIGALLVDCTGTPLPLGRLGACLVA
jgi:thiamine biosynthesis lipoprotein